ncbi:cytochrome b [Stappia sp. GBMRC 2046]|uniref:Cytochrome b n=1 Tax=Stappia sediminis TaxID=2692190 RepID=A0A7X3S5S2_9HYPH|nr:cytochrome b/b6 domain-containing protein [Stappia sediminis]MXN63437.1 cytochrome b [Stappia sediminis]
MSTSSPSNYSLAQITLHWLIAALVVFQLVFGESIAHAERALARGRAVDAIDLFLANAHIWAGFAILALMIARLGLRIRHGVPPAPEKEPAYAVLVMKAAHFLFYVLLFAAPITGAIAYYLLPEAGEIHEAMKPAFIVLIAIHVLAALWHQVILRDGVMKRMIRPIP